MQWLQHLKSQTSRPNVEHARKPLFRAAQHSQHCETSLQRAARPKKSPEGQTLYTRSIEFSMHINSSYITQKFNLENGAKKCPNLVISWRDIKGSTFIAKVLSLGWISAKI